MRLRAIFFLFCMSLLVGSFTTAAELDNGLAGESDASVAMHFDDQQMMKELVTRAQPAAGVTFERSDDTIERPTAVPYWKQKVMRKRRRLLSE